MLCPICVGQSLKSTVHEGGSKTTQAYCPPFYDPEGVRHHHDINIRSRSFRCSNGHSWTVQLPNTCACGWTSGVRDSRFPSETAPPPTNRPRAASMPDIILATSDSEVPPAGYEVSSVFDEEGYEFPVFPRSFSRIRPK